MSIFNREENDGGNSFTEGERSSDPKTDKSSLAPTYKKVSERVTHQDKVEGTSAKNGRSGSKDRQNTVILTEFSKEKE